VFGPVVTAGLGGVYSEVLNDVSYRVAPIGADEARVMLSELRGFRLFEGLRGDTARDLDAACECIERLSWFAADMADSIGEVDINRLIVAASRTGAIIADALLVRRAEKEAG
jgi:acetyltransferase